MLDLSQSKYFQPDKLFKLSKLYAKKIALKQEDNLLLPKPV